MKLFQKCNKLTVLFLCAVLAMGGCGKEGREDDPGSTPGGGSNAVSDTGQLMAYKEIRYLPEFNDTSEKYDAFGSSGIGFAEDTFYLVKRERTATSYGMSISGGQLIAYHPDTGAETILLDQADTDERLLAAAPAAEGAVMALLESGSAYRLCKVDSNGKEIFSRNIVLSEEPLSCWFIADTQERYYLITRGEIWLFDSQGNPSGTIDLSGKSINKAVRSKGTVYLYDYMANQIIPVDFETASLGTSPYSVPIMRMQAIAESKRADFLICDETTVYEYSCEEGSLTPLFDLQDSQISNAFGVDTIGEMEDGRLFLFYNDGQDVTETALLTPTPLEECPVKEIVTIGTVSADSSLLESVAKFNRQNEDFNISIINYCIGGRSYQEALSALKLDFSIGKGPDLCDLGYYYSDMEALVSSGCFADLSSFLEESQQYKREDFIEQALDIYTWQGQLTAIPKYFSLWTIAASPEVAGETMGWNMEDMKAIIQSHPDAMIFDDVSSLYMMDVCIRNMLDEFVDFDNHRADFDSPEYIDFLNFVSALPDNYNDQDSQTYNEWLQVGKTLYARREIRRFTDFQVIRADFGGEYTCKGFPSPDRTPDTIIQGFGGYAVSALSPNQDRAWRFLEWIHSAQGEESYLAMMVRPGFPTRKDVFERELEEAMEGREEDLGGFYHNGVSRAYRRTTSEEAELLRSLIESASPERSMGQTIVDIMEEEAVYLYDGSKTAEDVAKVTQNRVQLYLDEG